MRHFWVPGKRVYVAGLIALLVLSVFTTSLVLAPASTAAHANSPASSQAPLRAAQAPTYDVNFTEIGLLPATHWGVTLNGTAEAGVTQTLTFTGIANGTIPFDDVLAVAGYVATPTSGNVTVAGANTSVIISYVQWHTITFTEVGLPTGQTWSVTVPNVAANEANNSAPIVFTLNNTFNGTAPGGNYSYVVNPVAGYDITGVVGSVTCGTGYCVITNVSATVAVTYTLSPVQTIIFNETGLSAGTAWSVTLNGATITGTGTQITFGDINGTYPFTIGGGGIGVANASTPESGLLSVPGVPCGTNASLTSNGCTTSSDVTYQNVTFWPFTPTVITSSFTSTFSTNGLPYFTLPYNITWTVSISGPADAVIGADFTQVINVTWLVSGCGPFTFPCLPIFSSPVNPAWETGATATSGTFYFPLSLANLTGSTYLGFDLPEGQWQFSVYSNFNDTIGNASSYTLTRAAFMAVTGPTGQITQPVAWSNVTQGRTVISGSYSGYFVATANVTVYSSSGATVLTAPIYAPGTQSHAFAVPWAAVTPGAYVVNLTLTADWHQSFSFTVPVNITPGLPITYFNKTSPSLIPGLGNGGSAALLVTLGAIIGMIVMAVVGRGLWGGTKTGPAQPWSGEPAKPGETGGDTSGETSGSGSGGTTGGSGGMSGSGGSSPPT